MGITALGSRYLEAMSSIGRRSLAVGLWPLEGRVEFEPTTPGLEVRGSSAQLATRGREGLPAVCVGVAVDEVSLDDLPRKQEAAIRRPSQCMRCDD